MKVSARNSLPGVVKKIKLGAVNAEVTLELAPGLTIVSVITLGCGEEPRAEKRQDRLRRHQGVQRDDRRRLAARLVAPARRAATTLPDEFPPRHDGRCPAPRRTLRIAMSVLI